MNKKQTKKSQTRPIKDRAEDTEYDSDRDSERTVGKSRGKFDRRRKIKTSSYPKGSTSSYGSTANDPAWYAKDPQLMKDAGSLSFSNVLGLPITQLTNGLPYQDMNAWTTVPGVCTIDYVTAPGIATSNSDPINVAATNVYSFVRHMNSGHSNYEAEDLMLYILSMDEAYKFWSHMVRIYGIARLYSQQNRYYPVVMLKALGVDPQDVFRNLSDLRSYINYTSNRLGSMCVPSVFPFIERHIWLQQRIYRDSETPKAQSYMFTSTKYRTWVEATGGTPAYLEAHQFPSTNMSVGDMRIIMDSIIDPIVGSGDFGIMSGDIKKAFGSNVYYLDSIPEDYVTESVYNEEVLSQIENAVAIGWPPSLNVSEFNITQSPGNGIRFNPTISEMTGSTDNYVLNMHMDDPTPEDVMVATRLVPHIGVNQIDGNTGNFTVASCGTELVLGFYYHRINGSNFAVNVRPLISRYKITRDAAGVDFLTEIATMKSVFRWSPTFYIYTPTTATPTWQDYRMVFPLADLDNYTIIGGNELVKLHQCALLSELDVPKVGAKNSANS